MELQDFVSKTIVEICAGIKDAQGKVHDMTGNVAIAPAYLNGRNLLESNSNAISFDLSVTTTGEENSTSDAGIKIKVISGNIGKETKTHNESVNKINFSVPFYPQSLSNYDKGRRGRN